MLRKETSTFILILFLLFFLSCEKRSYKYFPTINNDFSKVIRDTLFGWKEDTLANSKPYFFSDNWRVDDLVIYNFDSTLVYTTLNLNNADWKHAMMDNINDIGGAKINGKWYFYFMNVSMPVSRTLYKDTKYTPYTFEELSYIAHRHRFSLVVNWKEDGSYTVKEDYFEKRLLKPIRKKCIDSQDFSECFDSVITSFNKHYHSRKIDTKELNEIKEEMAKSVKPVEPPAEKQELSWWDRIFGNEREVKFFNSKHWEEYIASKQNMEKK